jgi:hypothetical protein
MPSNIWINVFQCFSMQHLHMVGKNEDKWQSIIWKLWNQTFKIWSNGGMGMIDYILNLYFLDTLVGECLGSSILKNFLFYNIWSIWLAFRITLHYYLYMRSKIALFLNFKYTFIIFNMYFRISMLPNIIHLIPQFILQK